MSIKIGDKVKDIFGDIGTVENVFTDSAPQIALVRHNDGSLRKRTLDGLEPICDTVRLTREDFNEYMSKVVDRETLDDMDDGTYRMYQVTAELIGKRLEALLFGSGDNG